MKKIILIASILLVVFNAFSQQSELSRSFASEIVNPIKNYPYYSFKTSTVAQQQLDSVVTLGVNYVKYLYDLNKNVKFEQTYSWDEATSKWNIHVYTEYGYDNDDNIILKALYRWNTQKMHG